MKDIWASVLKWEKEIGALKTETHKSYTQTLLRKLELISETECFVWLSQAKGIGADKETYLWVTQHDVSQKLHSSLWHFQNLGE